MYTGNDLKEATERDQDRTNFSETGDEFDDLVYKKRGDFGRKLMRQKSRGDPEETRRQPVFSR